MERKYHCVPSANQWRFMDTYAKLENLSKGLKDLDGMRPTASKDDAKEIDEMHHELVVEMRDCISFISKL